MVGQRDRRGDVGERQLARERGRHEHVPFARAGARRAPGVQAGHERRALLRRNGEADGDLRVQVVVVGVAVARVGLAMHLCALGQMQAHEVGRRRQARRREQASVVAPPSAASSNCTRRPPASTSGQRRAAQDVEGQRAVVERARERTDVVERRRERPQPVGRHAAEGRLEAGHAAGSRGSRIEAPVSVPSPSAHRPGRERARVAARRAARDAVGARAVDDGAVGAVARGHAPGELVQIGLAEHDRAGVEQPAHARRRAHRDVVTEDPRAVGRAHARRVEDVLDEQRHAGQRPERDARARPRAPARP